MGVQSSLHYTSYLEIKLLNVKGIFHLVRTNNSVLKLTTLIWEVLVLIELKHEYILSIGQ